MTVWLTGLSGSGKSTIGGSLVAALQARGLPAVLLDGDQIRSNLTRELGYSRQDRDEQVQRVGWLCQLLNNHGIIAVAALISPYRATRDRVRSQIGQFIEVHVDAPLHVLEARDTKGLYRKSRSGHLDGMTGIDAPYEKPTAPEVRCLSDGTDDVMACVTRILAVIDGVRLGS